MRKFPGRTPDELDCLDWPRLMRALKADDVMRIEEMRDLQLQKKAKPDAADWRKIQEHDALYRKVKDNGNRTGTAKSARRRQRQNQTGGEVAG